MLLRVAAALVLTVGAVAAVLMQMASGLLRSAQAEDRATYDMGALTGLPPRLFSDSDVVGAYGAWRDSAVIVDQDGREQLDESLLSLVTSLVTWHVRLDLALMAAVAVLLHWLLRCSLTPGRRHWAVRLPLLYLAADLLETAWTRWLTPQLLGAEPVTSTWATQVLPVLSLVKWVVLVGTLAVAVLGHLASQRRFGPVSAWGRRIWAVRVQAAAVLVLTVMIALPIPGPMDQVPDLLRSAHDHGWRSASFLLPSLALGALAVMVWASGLLVVSVLEVRRAGTGADEEPNGVGAESARAGWLRSRRRWLVLFAVLLVVAGLLKWAFGGLEASWGVFAGPVLLGVALLLDAALHHLDYHVHEDRSAAHRWRVDCQDAPSVEWCVGVLAAGVLAVAGLGAVRAYGVLVLLQEGDPGRPVHPGAVGWLWFGVLGSTVVPLLVLGALRWVARQRWRFRLAKVLVLVVGVTACGLGAVALVAPADFGRTLPAHGVVALWLTVLLSLFGWLQWDAERRPPVPLARAVGLGRSPWVLALVALVLLAGRMDDRVGYHSVTRAAPDGAQQELAEAYDAWRTAAEACRGPDGELPLVLVAAPGGGARAAYWTGQVVAALEAGDRCDGGSVFAASGVSGGSVGLAAWTATRDLPRTEARAQLGELVGADALGATVSALLFRDLARAFVPVHLPDRDRAAVEQGVWEETVPGLAEPFLPTTVDPPSDGPWRTRLLLNASDLRHGCKVLVSQLRTRPEGAASTAVTAQACRQHPDPGSPGATTLEAGSVDAADFLDPADCSQAATDTRDIDTRDTDTRGANLTLAAASLLSARFPYVSPPGLLTHCPEAADRGPERLFVADGGYLENSGLHTLLALWHDLAPLVAADERVRPVVVLAENHYRSDAALRSGNRVRELTAPPQADRTTLVGSVALEQWVAARFPGDWYVVAPTTRPAVSAPLGWSLSEAARTGLDCELPRELAAGPVEEQLCVGGSRPSDPVVGDLVDRLG